MQQYNTDTALNYEGRLTATLRQVFLKMTLGLTISAITAIGVLSSPELLNLMFSSRLSMFALLGIELLLVFAISGAVKNMSATTATLLFVLFAVINGASLTPIFLVYTGASIAKTFFLTAGVFGAMSTYGYTTRTDLSRFGSLLFMALIGLVLVAVVNIFLHSTALEMIISGAGVLIFVGLTAWDVQKIKLLAQQTDYPTSKLSTLGALTLYLDFVNLFLYLLRFFGDRR